MVDDFEHYSACCFAAFGDKCKDWITFNEPWCSTVLGHQRTKRVSRPGRSIRRCMCAMRAWIVSERDEETGNLLESISVTNHPLYTIKISPNVCLTLMMLYITLMNLIHDI